MRTRFLFATFACSLIGACFFASAVAAAPGAYKALLAEAYPDQPKKLGAQLATLPDVASVDFANTGEGGATPSAAQLAPYDVVVSIGDSTYLDVVGWGNSLADFIDQGGVVVQSAYDNWSSTKAFPQGRFESGGYAPFIPGNNVNDATSLGTFDATSPLMQGITTLTTNENNTAPLLAPGASLIAKWLTGNNAIAVKGRVVSVSAFIGDREGPEAWSGDYGRLVLNAVRILGPQVLTVVNANPGGGTVTGPGGLLCGSICSAAFDQGTPVGLEAKATRANAFAGFSGGCAGVTCTLTMDGPKTVEVRFFSFRFGRVRARNLKRGRASLQVKVGGPGRLIVFGRKIKKRGKVAKASGTVAIPIIARGRAASALAKNGKVKVGVKLAFIPSGGAKANLSRSLVLRRKLR
jgi:hypothetical protein